MSKHVNDSAFVFIVDVLISTLASFLAILFARYLNFIVSNYVYAVLSYGIGSMVFSIAAVAISKTYTVIFRDASFKSILYILYCALIKVAIIGLFLLFYDYFPFKYELVVIIIDFSFTMFGLVMTKLISRYYAPQDEEENNEEENRLVRCINTYIYGTSRKSLSAAVRYRSSKRYNVKGFITRDTSLKHKIIQDLPVMYISEKIADSRLNDAEAVIFVTHEEFDDERDRLVRQCLAKGICVYSVPTINLSNYSGMAIHDVKHVMETNYIPDNMNGIQRTIKRLFDFTVSGILIILFSPVMTLIAYIIYKNDGEPVIYKQERIGRFGRPFQILKFRTMRLDAEADGPALYQGDDDPRMTKVGRFLRLHHLDEMPQLFNVFLGDMSFVGYRPERPFYVKQIIELDPRYTHLYQIRPGVTSYATLNNGYADNIEKMLRRLNLDLFYLNHRTNAFDLKVLWDTFINIAFGKKF